MFTRETKVIDETKVNELSIEISRLKKDFENETSRLKKDLESEKRILLSEIQTQVNQATEGKEKEIGKVREENSVLKKEVEILEKAFENMGFDVRDMKEILNKLVDGIVSKNEIKIIK